jgi:hypothetical protein
LVTGGLGGDAEAAASKARAIAPTMTQQRMSEFGVQRSIL